MKLHHTAIAVHDIERAASHYQQHFLLKEAGRDRVEEQGVAVIFLSCGETLLELISPLPGTEGAISKFLEKRGEGLHHLCFATDDIEKELLRATENGLTLIDKTARIGAMKHKIAFLHPKDNFGTLIELVEIQE